jgi:ABC-type multidrug transport system fused ATPase/permease subunit
MATLCQSLYAYIWQTSRSKQLAICLLTMVMSPLALVPLELQRRIINNAIAERDLSFLALLGAAYFVVLVLQGGLKFLLNMTKGAAAETIARDLRLKIMRKVSEAQDHNPEKTDFNAGTAVSMLASETEEVSGFAGDALAVPLLSAGTILYVAGYLLWVQPAIAILAVIIYLPQVVIVPATQHTINRLARLRIQLVRNLGHVASLLLRRSISHTKIASGRFLIFRLYRVRIWIYFRKYLLAALGNFLDALGTLIVLVVGGYLVIQGQTQVGTLVVFISGLNRIADPWDQLINFYRAVSNTAVVHDMILQRLK